MTSQWDRWRHKSPASPLFTQPFIRAQIKENTKAPRHWPLCREITGTGEFPAQMASNTENVSIWWRHHGFVLNWRFLQSSIQSIHIFSYDFVEILRTCKITKWPCCLFYCSMNISPGLGGSFHAINLLFCMKLSRSKHFEGPTMVIMTLLRWLELSFSCSWAEEDKVQHTYRARIYVKLMQFSFLLQIEIWQRRKVLCNSHSTFRLCPTQNVITL